MKLRPYQQGAFNAILEKARAGVDKQVVVMATGTGKSPLVAALAPLVKAKGKKTLFLAHREELLTQMERHVKEADPTLKVSIEQAEKKADPDADVIIASVPSIGRENSERIKKFDPSAFGLLVQDECQHICASTSINVLKYFGVYKPDGPNKNGIVLLGVTATPNRSDHQGLGQIFDEIVFNYPLLQAIQEGYLVNIQAFNIQTKTDISIVHVRAGDFAENELADAVDNPERNRLIVESYTEICPHEKTLVFAASVDHAYTLADLFRQAGYKAICLEGNTPSEERKKILEDYRSADLEVIVNVSVLTEGVDLPMVRTVMMTRPTKSSVLFSQTLGRATRLFPGKDHAKLIDFVDNTGKHSVMNLPSLFGLPKALKVGKGKLITKVLAQVEKIQGVCPDYPVENIEDWSDENIEKIVTKVDLFAQAQPDKVIIENSDFVWAPYREGGYRLNFPADEYGAKESISIVPNMLDSYTVTLEIFTPVVPEYSNGFSKTKLAKKESYSVKGEIKDALHYADNFIKEKRPNYTGMLDSKAKWRLDSPTEAQIKLLRKLGVGELPKGFSKGDASNLIGKKLAEPRRF